MHNKRKKSGCALHGATPYACAWSAFVLPVKTDTLPDLGAGFSVLWNPELLVFIELVWLGVFVNNGWSKVTSSTVSIPVH